MKSRRAIYTKINSTLVTRNGRRCSNMGMFVGILISFTVFCVVLTSFGTKLETIPSNLNLRLAELPSWGYNQSLNVDDYMNTSSRNSFILDPSDVDFCGLRSTISAKLLVIVISAPQHFLQRKTIRETWGNPTDLNQMSIKLYFLIGRTTNETVGELVVNEFDTYGDIIEDDFLDTYHNLTLKSISMLKWINATCYNSNLTSAFPDFVLKVDDDVFVNFNRLFSVIKQMPDAKLIGRLICGAEPIADIKSKLFMPGYLYPGRVYPGYLSGTAYVLRGDIIPQMLQTARITPLIHMEDIYITGMVAKKSNIIPEDSPFFTYSKIDSKDICVLKEMVSSHLIEPEEMLKIWSMLKTDMSGNCSKILTPKVRKKLFRRPVPRYARMNKRIRKLCMFPVV